MSIPHGPELGRRRPDVARRRPGHAGTGLYRPEMEHDACGVAFVADMRGRASHEMVEMGLASLCHLEHRGAKGADPDTGDGAGVTVQVPDRFLRANFEIELPPVGSYATGIAFLPADDQGADEACRRFEALARRRGPVGARLA